MPWKVFRTVHRDAADYNSPEAAPIRSHMPPKPQDATLQQLTDSSKATEPEVSAVFTI